MTSATSPAESDNSMPVALASGVKLLAGQYTIASQLSAGGFGITYLAKDSLKRTVVVKECFPDSMCVRDGNEVKPDSKTSAATFRSVVESFMREAQNQAEMDHPGVAGIHQVFKDNNTAYMAIDFIEGADLFDVRLQTDRASAENVERWLKKSLSAISSIHAKKTLHRDLSPDNILIDGKNNPILIDFGAARSELAEGDDKNISVRAVKDGYSPPEFYKRGAKQSFASDLYSLAATFYYLVRGEAPTSADARSKAIASKQDDPYVPLEGSVQGWSLSVLQTIDKSLSIAPTKRFQTADEWLKEMEKSDRRSALVSKKPEKVPQKTEEKQAEGQETKPRKKSPILSIFALFVLAVVGGGYYFSTMSPSTGSDVVATNEPVEEPVVQETQAAGSEEVSKPEPSDETVNAPEANEPTETASAPAETTPTPREPIAITAETLAAEAERLAATQGDVSSVVEETSWALDLPFSTAPSQTQQGTFARVMLIRPDLPVDMAEWLQSGSLIYSVDGNLVSDQAAIESQLNTIADLNQGEPFTATLRVRTNGDSAIEERALELEPGYLIQLKNGFEFNVEQIGTDGWETKVHSIPNSVETGLKVGDVLRSEALSGLALRERDSIVKIALHFAQQDLDTGFFTIARKGLLESANMSFETAQ